jgi:hypothetical protein
MATTLGKPSDKADRPDKPQSLRVAAKCGVCVVALLGFVVLATTFVAHLASFRILPATQSAEDLIRGSTPTRKKAPHSNAVRRQCPSSCYNMGFLLLVVACLLRFPP